MRHVLLILLLILSSCKTATTEDEVDASVAEMWKGFTNSNSQYKGADIPESFYFHDNKEDAKRLAALVLNGKKNRVPHCISFMKNIMPICQKLEQNKL